MNISQTLLGPGQRPLEQLPSPLGKSVLKIVFKLLKKCPMNLGSPVIEKLFLRGLLPGWEVGEERVVQARQLLNGEHSRLWQD